MSLEQNTLVKALLSERVKMVGYLLAIVRQREMAEDIFQDVCVLALQKQSEIVDRAHLLGWMRVTGRNLALNALRKDGKRKQLLSDEVMNLLDAQWQELDDTPSSSVLESLEACLQELSERVRTLLHDKYAGGVAMEEIARRLNRPVGSVYVTLSRAHRALSDCVFQKVALARRGLHG